MNLVCDYLALARRFAFRRPLGCMTILLALTSVAVAKPITYVGFTIADGKLGNWTFHNARVYFVMQGDTNTVQALEAPNPVDPTDPVDVLINPAGNSSVTVISGSRVVHANFDPNQIFVSMDLGLVSGRPNIGGRGVGLGMFTPTGVEPAYPLDVEDGTIDWGDIVEGGVGTPSTALQALPISLSDATVFSGRAFACVGFAANGSIGTCPTSSPLHTDKGDFFVSLPYDKFAFNTPPQIGDALGSGFFWSMVEVEAKQVTLAPSLPSTPVRYAAKPITYRGYTTADVALGTRHFPGAQVYLSMDADAANAVPFGAGNSHGFKNASGNAHVTVVANGLSFSADFAPGQIYAYFDVGTASVGFGSQAGGAGYPLSIAGFRDDDGLAENSSMAAVTDIINTPLDAEFYTPPTATLVTDLTNATVLSGGASSCAAPDFDPLTSICTDLTPKRLKTNRGDFTISEPYTGDHGAGPYSVSWDSSGVKQDAVTERTRKLALIAPNLGLVARS